MSNKYRGVSKPSRPTSSRSKIQDTTEVERWYEEGRTFAWMAEEYMRRYNTEITAVAFSALARRRGWPPRNDSSRELIPWEIKPEHKRKRATILDRLRAEKRRRAGLSTTPERERTLDTWLKGLHEANAVVHYDPDAEQGFFYVPREPVDTDIVRMPKR